MEMQMTQPESVSNVQRLANEPANQEERIMKKMTSLMFAAGPLVAPHAQSRRQSFGRMSEFAELRTLLGCILSSEPSQSPDRDLAHRL
jgi:hypothetical protein